MVVTTPLLERQRRIAEGKCPDCGYEHGYLPTNGGAWRCVVCGNRFMLQPGAACMQECAPGTGRGCRVLQRPRAPHPDHAEWFTERRMGDAVDDLRDSLAPEHAASIDRWIEARGAVGEELGLPGESVRDLLDRLRPPTIVRAVWLLIGHHVQTRLSVSLAPPVAEAYLRDPDAWPASPCGGCGYPLPAHVTLRPDNRFEDVRRMYMGACPICGLDNESGDGRWPRG